MCIAALGSTSCAALFRGSAADDARASAPAEPARAEAAVSVVAVFDVEDGTERLDAKEVRQLGDYLAAQVASIPGTRVVPRDQLRSAILDAKADSYKVCFDQSCQIELGKAVSASKTVATKLLRVGTRCAMTTAIYDLKTETTERAATTRTDCTADALFNAVDALVHELGGPAPKRPDALARADVRTTDARADGRTTDVARSAEPRRTTAREEPPIELVLDESATNSATSPAVSTAGLTNASATTTLDPRAASKGSSTSVGTDVERSKDVASDAPLEVRWIARRGQRILRFPRPVTFAENVDTLDASAKRMLEQAALAILRDPALRHVKLEVVGHAEARERGKPELSERRARAARAFLVDRGAPLARLALVAAADRDPLSAGARPADRAQNRRVELRIALED